MWRFDKPRFVRITLFPAMQKSTSDSLFELSRRRFLKSTAAASAWALAPRASGTPEDAPTKLPPAFSSLKPLGSRVHPITAEEFRERLLHPQKLMTGPQPQYT